MHVPIFIYYDLYLLTSMDFSLTIINIVKLKFSLLLEILQAFKFHSLTEYLYFEYVVSKYVFIKYQLGIKAV